MRAVARAVEGGFCLEGGSECVRGLYVAFTSRTAEWGTPRWVLDALGPFDDDPSHWGRGHGLQRAWQGFVWMNPPYGKATAAWMKRMHEHANGIALVFARTDTKWWQTYTQNASAFFFFAGRLRFVPLAGQRVTGCGTAPSVLVGYGEEAASRLYYFDAPGQLMVHWTPTE